jgi:peptide/nickel transport system permease protein
MPAATGTGGVVTGIGRAFRARSGRLGAIVLAVIIGAAVALPPMLPDPLAIGDLTAGMQQGPSAHHPFGTDQLSRDILARTVAGARISLSIALPAVAIALSLGAVVGLVTGYLGGWVDALLMRLVDGLMAIPRIFVLLLLLAAWDRLPAWALPLVIGATGWLGTSRMVRAEVLRVAREEFVRAAESLGATRRRIALRHLLPNALGPLLVAGTVGLADAVLLESGLSYLGLGLAPPTPSWGSMLADGKQFLSTAPWAALFPGLALVLTVLGAHLLADALERALRLPRA